MKSWAIVTAALVAVFGFLLSPSLADERTTQPALTVTKCIVVSLPPSSHAMAQAGVEVGFRNNSGSTIRAITWRARYGSGWIDFDDNGRFDNGEAYDNELWINKSLLGAAKVREGYIGQNVPGDCEPFSVTYADGTTWIDTSKPQDHLLIPDIPSDDSTPVPSIFPNASSDPVGIVACKIEFDRGRRGGTGGLFVRFRNLSNETIDKVVFRGFDRMGNFFDFIFGGSFSPQTLIDSKNRLLRGDLPGSNPPMNFESLTSQPHVSPFR